MGHDADCDESAGPGGNSPVRLIHVRPRLPCVFVHGRLDHTTAPGIRQIVVDLLAAAPWAVVLDLRTLTGLTPDAVPALIELASRAGEADIGLYLVTADPIVDQTLAAAGVSELFEVHPTIDSALRAMGRPP